jgi:hypothetical protein
MVTVNVSLAGKLLARIVTDASRLTAVIVKVGMTRDGAATT